MDIENFMAILFRIYPIKQQIRSINAPKLYMSVDIVILWTGWKTLAGPGRSDQNILFTLRPNLEWVGDLQERSNTPEGIKVCPPQLIFHPLFRRINIIPPPPGKSISVRGNCVRFKVDYVCNYSTADWSRCTSHLLKGLIRKENNVVFI